MTSHQWTRRHYHFYFGDLPEFDDLDKLETVRTEVGSLHDHDLRD